MILLMQRDAAGSNTFSPNFSKVGFQTTLVANIEQTLTIPVNEEVGYPNTIAIFSFDPGLRVFVALNETADVPGSSFSPTYSDLNPTARTVKAGDVLSFITIDPVAVVNVKIYAI